MNAKLWRAQRNIYKQYLINAGTIKANTVRTDGEHDVVGEGLGLHLIMHAQLLHQLAHAWE